MKLLYLSNLLLKIIPFSLTFTISLGVSHSQILESEIKPDGIVFPRMDTNARNLLTAVQGQCIYNIDNNSIECFDGVTWMNNSGTNTGSNSNSQKFKRQGSLIRYSESGVNEEGIVTDLTMFNRDTFMLANAGFDNFRGTVIIENFFRPNFESVHARLEGENINDRFRISLSSTNDGKHVVIGADNADNGVGAVYFGNSSNLNDLSQYQKISNPSGINGTGFGWSTDIDNNYAVVGAGSDNKVYIFKYNGNNWVLDWTLSSPNPSSSRMGYQVAIDGSKVIASDIETEEVYVFKNNAGSWSHLQTIGPTTDCLNASLCANGLAIDISGPRICTMSIIGEVISYRQDSNGFFNFDKIIEISPARYRVLELGKQHLNMSGNILATRLSDNTYHVFCDISNDWIYQGCTLIEGNAVEISKDQSTMICSSAEITSNFPDGGFFHIFSLIKGNQIIHEQTLQ